MPKTSPERAKVDEAREARLRPILADAVRRYFGNNQSAAADFFFVTPSMVSQVLAGKKSVSYPFVLGIARVTGQSLDELEGLAGPRWGAQEGWAEAVAAARVAFPRVSELAWERLASLRGAPPPLPLEPGYLGAVASGWDRSDEGRNAINSAQARREMAEIDARPGAVPPAPDPGPMPVPRRRKAS